MFRRIHGMHGTLRPVSHLHVTLIFLGGTADAPEAVVETIGHISKAATAVVRPFEIKFDQVVSFRRNSETLSLVLADDNCGNDGVRNLHELLCAEFLKYFPSSASPQKFVPHLTLLYDQQELASKSIEPVSWMVKEIVLVRSEVGLTKYRRLGCWALGEQGCA